MNHSRKLIGILTPGIILVVVTAYAASPHVSYDKGRSVDGQQGDTAAAAAIHERHYGYTGGPPPWFPEDRNFREEEYDRFGQDGWNMNPASGRCNRGFFKQVLAHSHYGPAVIRADYGLRRLKSVASETVAGIVVNGEPGRAMDRLDRLCMDYALEHVPDGSTIHWNEKDRWYYVTPQVTRKNANGGYCREYYVEAEVGARMRRAFGRACRLSSGAWRIKS